MGNADISRAALAPCQQGCHGVHELLAIATIFMYCQIRIFGERIQNGF